MPTLGLELLGSFLLDAAALSTLWELLTMDNMVPNALSRVLCDYVGTDVWCTRGHVEKGFVNQKTDRLSD